MVATVCWALCWLFIHALLALTLTRSSELELLQCPLCKWENRGLEMDWLTHDIPTGSKGVGNDVNASTTSFFVGSHGGCYPIEYELWPTVLRHQVFNPCLLYWDTCPRWTEPFVLSITCHQHQAYHIVGIRHVFVKWIYYSVDQSPARLPSPITLVFAAFLPQNNRAAPSLGSWPLASV